MKTDDFKTNVIFRKEKDGTIVALFPHETEYNGLVTCYVHVGQHSAADYSYCIAQSKPAKEEEYNDLYQELTSIGYNLNVIKKRNTKKFLSVLHKARK